MRTHDQRQSLDLTQPPDRRVEPAGRRLKRFDLARVVATGGHEVKRIAACKVGIILLPGIRIEQQIHALSSRDALVVATTWADLGVLFPLLGIDQLTAAITFLHQTLRDLLLLFFSSGCEI